MTVKFSVRWLPVPYEAWGVIIFDDETRRGIIPAYYYNELDSKAKAEAHATRLEREYQPELPL
jgi:hypothetical protein